ncbi:MAG: HAD-IB family phosphatase [Gemmatimonadaceae bacterium]
MAPKFQSIVLDIDSTLSEIEGIDWLAAQRGEEIRAQVAESTKRAMRGEISIASVFGSRLALVAPSRDEIAKLGEEYVARVQFDAKRSLAILTSAGVRIVLVSAGLYEAVLPLAHHLGISDADVHAVHVHFTNEGAYAGFDEDSPVTRNGGKAVVVRSLALEHLILGVGDGITDLETRIANPPAVDAFAAYTGVVTRKQVVNRADYVIQNFEELLAIALAD